MIIGVGTDLIRVSRMESALQRHGDRLPMRILQDEEMARFRASKRPANFLAKSFAVKEATVKALGLGFRGVGYRDYGWIQDALGKPMVNCSEKGRRVMRSHGAHNAHLSLTDEGDLVMAFVVLESSGGSDDLLVGDVSASPF